MPFRTTPRTNPRALCRILARSATTVVVVARPSSLSSAAYAFCRPVSTATATTTPAASLQPRTPGLGDARSSLRSKRAPFLPIAASAASSSSRRGIFGMSPTTVVAARTALDEHGTKGEFKRTEAVWRNWIGKDTGFPAEKDRYHLYVAYACPWAHRTLMMRALKGLEDVISITVVHPTWQKTRPGQDEHTGWVFGDPSSDGTLTNSAGNGGPFPSAFPGNAPDPILGAKSIRDVYEAAGDTNGKYSVPVLFDKKTKTIVNGESAEIIRMLNKEFNDFAKNPELDLYPEELRDEIDKINDWVYPTINNGVYRCGFAKTQVAYDEAIAALTESFDRIDGILQQQRFLCGDRFTEADLRLFVTLLRFDEVYVVYFKTNTRTVAHTPAILNYCREIYQMPGVKATVNMEQIKAHYFTSHPLLNHYSIIPRGPDFVALLEQPHNRDSIGGGSGNGKKHRIDES